MVTVSMEAPRSGHAGFFSNFKNHQVFLAHPVNK
jgi:hypothetical protein